MPAGRPKLFAAKRQLNVLVSLEDYRALKGIVATERMERPPYSMGELLRTLIRSGLEAKRPALRG
jgi:hypothetical protein